MKNAFGATLLFQIVIFFVVLFTGYICLSINQAKAFNVKNEIVKAMERHAPEFTTLDFREDIQSAFDKTGYRLMGKCDDGYFACDKNGNCNTIVTSNASGAFCVKPITSTIAGQNAVYYKIQTFYQLDIPILRSFFNLKAEGETKLIYKKGI